MLERETPERAHAALNERTGTLLREQKLEEAKGCALVALRQSGGTAGAAASHWMLGRVFKASGQLSSATEQMQRSLSLKPSFSHGWLELARTHYAQREGSPHQMLSAASALERAVELQPSSQMLWEMLADAYHELSRSNFTHAARAISCCQAALSLSPKAAGTYTNLAKILTESGRHRESVDAARHALRIEPNSDRQYQLAEALFSARAHSEAQATYRSMLTSQWSGPPAEADVHNHLAVSLLEDISGAPRAERDEGVGERAALEHARHAVQLEPACRYAHAHNYYQVSSHLRDSSD